MSIWPMPRARKMSAPSCVCIRLPAPKGVLRRPGARSLGDKAMEIRNELSKYLR